MSSKEILFTDKAIYDRNKNAYVNLDGDILFDRFPGKVTDYADIRICDNQEKNEIKLCSISFGYNKVVFYGYCKRNENNKLVFLTPLIYDYAKDFLDEYALIATGGRINVLLDRNGMEVRKTLYFDIKIFYDANLYCIYEDHAHEYQFYNFNHERVSYNCYQSTRDEFIDGLLIVRESNGMAGCINKDGKEVIPCVYSNITNFIDAYYKVFLNGKYGIIDKKNNIIVDVVYDDIKLLEDYIIYYKNGSCGLKDLDGKEILSCRYKDIKIASKKNRTFIVKFDDDTYALKDINGNSLKYFRKFGMLNNERIIISDNSNNEMVIDSNGRYIYVYPSKYITPVYNFFIAKNEYWRDKELIYDMDGNLICNKDEKCEIKKYHDNYYLIESKDFLGNNKYYVLDDKKILYKSRNKNKVLSMLDKYVNSKKENIPKEADEIYSILDEIKNISSYMDDSNKDKLNNYVSNLLNDYNKKVNEYNNKSIFNNELNLSLDSNNINYIKADLIAKLNVVVMLLQRKKDNILYIKSINNYLKNNEVLDDSIKYLKDIDNVFRKYQSIKDKYYNNLVDILKKYLDLMIKEINIDFNINVKLEDKIYLNMLEDDLKNLLDKINDDEIIKNQIDILTKDGNIEFKIDYGYSRAVKLCIDEINGLINCVDDNIKLDIQSKFDGLKKEFNKNINMASSIIEIIRYEQNYLKKLCGILFECEMYMLRKKDDIKLNTIDVMYLKREINN